MTLQIIILGGGKGTRLRSEIGETPKILAPIKNISFLDWLLLWIKSWNLKSEKELLISTCFGHEKIERYCKEKGYPTNCILEKNPLGTFGAIANVATKKKCDDYLIINGDTIFKADMKMISKKYFDNKTKKPLLLIKKNSKNLINGGYKKIKSGWIYTYEETNFISLGAFFISYEELKRRWINSTSIPFNNSEINKFSKKEIMIDKDCFSKDFIYAEKFPEDTPFIDIGIASDYIKAQTFIPKIIKN